MAAILIDIRPGDEIIAPSYAYVSTANAFRTKGAKVVFADCLPDIPNIDASQVGRLITPRTKAIIALHYGGFACDMEPIMAMAEKHDLFVIEDAAQAIDSYYKETPLGSIGHLAAFSFHDTKNITCGEGGMLAVNDTQFDRRAEIIWEKGTNRAAFVRGEVERYEWLDVGSSFLPSEILAAFLYAQLESLDDIQRMRRHIWDTYFRELECLQETGKLALPPASDDDSNNAHLFYLVCKDLKERDRLIARLQENGITAIFHYLSLHKSPFYKDTHGNRELKNCDRFNDCLLRLPFFCELGDQDLEKIIGVIKAFYR
jgi:dTDP-4-amino-4,6-dideoxygalactose transaminase